MTQWLFNIMLTDNEIKTRLQMRKCENVEMWKCGNVINKMGFM